MAQMLRKVHKYPFLLPRYQLPDWLVFTFGPLFGLSRHMMRTHVGIHFTLDNSRSMRDLGVVYRPLEETLADHYRSWCAMRQNQPSRLASAFARLGRDLAHQTRPRATLR